MSLPEIKAMPVPDVLEDDAFVFLWVINTHMPDVNDIFKAWGLKYMFTMTWDKGHGPKPAGYPTYNSEFIVVGRKGKPQFVDTKAFALVNKWPRRSHSEKPSEFYDLVHRVTKGRRLDIFARSEIEGFDVWGAEAPCQEHDWVFPPPGRFRPTFWAICVSPNCGAIEELVEFGRGVPDLEKQPVWPGYPGYSSRREDAELYIHDDGWKWDYGWGPSEVSRYLT